MPLGSRGVPILLGLALVSVCAGAVCASDAAFELGVDVALGYDSNPLRLNAAGLQRGSAFTELTLQGGVGLPLSRRVDATLDGRVTTRLHESLADHGDREDLDLTAALEIRPNPRSRRRLLLRVGAGLGIARSTFTDRTTGEIYQVASQPIPGRFDADTAGAFVDARWRVHRRVRVSLAARLDEARYPDDYSTSTNLLALDYDAFSLRPGIQLQIGGKVVLSFDAVLSDVDYDAQPALDGAGQEIAATLREYRYANYSMTVRWVPSPRWNLRLGVVDGTRDDTYAGYYDFGSSTLFASLDHRPSRRDRFQVYATTRHLDYSAAPVPGGVNGEFRGNDVNRFLARYDRTFGRQLGGFVVAGTQYTVSADPIFSYDRDWFETGLRYRL